MYRSTLCLPLYISYMRFYTCQPPYHGSEPILYLNIIILGGIVSRQCTSLLILSCSRFWIRTRRRHDPTVLLLLGGPGSPNVAVMVSITAGCRIGLAQPK